MPEVQTHLLEEKEFSCWPSSPPGLGAPDGRQRHPDGRPRAVTGEPPAEGEASPRGHFGDKLHGGQGGRDIQSPG